MNPENEKVLERLIKGNEIYVSGNQNAGDVSLAVRQLTAKEGQHPYAIVITCSDSRVIPDAIFSAGIGELFVIRVAGNVLDNHQLGSIEYAFSHLDANVIVMLGHTKCGAVEAAMHSHGGTDKFIRYIIEDINEAIGDETDDYKATVLNVQHGVNIIEKAFHDHPDIEDDELDVLGAVYDIETGEVTWLKTR
ncbi:carbonic anhydrase [Lachnospiraceae bacterium NE2001]|nr:carbonic anhydrase [Lachnospiraceae bacterium NE2001]